MNKVTRRVHAVEQVSFDLYPGETLALVGESGCGKSTTGRSLLRLVESQRGAIEFGGRNILELPRSQVQSLRRDIQFIFQDPFASLDPRLTVGFSIMEPLLVHKVGSPAEAQARAVEEIRRAGLTDEAKAVWAVQGADFPNLTGAQFDAFIKAELKKWGQVVKASGAKLD